MTPKLANLATIYKADVSPISMSLKYVIKVNIFNIFSLRVLL